MIDIRKIRSEPDLVRDMLRRRGVGGDVVSEILDLDRERRNAITTGDSLRATRNDVSRRIGELKRAGADASVMISEMQEVAAEIARLEQLVSEQDRAIETILLGTPNLPAEQVPDGGPDANELVRSWGEPIEHPFEAQPHWDLGEALGILDMAAGARISGSGFPVLRGAGARLQRVLIDWMLDIHVREHGYEELRVPYLVTEEVLTGTGQLPKFSEDSYVTERDNLWLIPTAEVPVTNLHRGQMLAADRLPLRYTAYSPCFRREAGAAGKDTRGLLRVHQFDKVELVRLERPERSATALEEMTAEAESVLRRLGLTYRVVKLAAGDLGFAAAMTYDLEVWAPGVEQWLEVSSCSNCLDYQARRADLRFRPAPSESPEFLHTLNGSALALPRLMVALLETYQEEDGGVRIPEPLRDRFGAGRLQP